MINITFKIFTVKVNKLYHTREFMINDTEKSAYTILSTILAIMNHIIKLLSYSQEVQFGRCKWEGKMALLLARMQQIITSQVQTPLLMCL